MKHWGDTICAHWSAELLKRAKPDYEVIIDPTYRETPNSSPRSILDYVTVPRSNGYEIIDAKQALHYGYDRIIATHHRHCHKRDMYAGIDGDRMIYYDAHGISYRFVTTEEYPTFLPSDQLEEEFRKLNLPEQYVVLHVNDVPAEDVRHVMPAQRWLSENMSSIKKSHQNIDLVSTSIHADGTRKLSSLHGWLKLLVMVRASAMYVSHSGFTSIASLYRKRINSFLVNAKYPGVLNMGPPPICYSNYHVIKGSDDALYAAIEGRKIAHASGSTYKRWCEQEWSRQWSSYSTLGVKDVQIRPDGYRRKEFYDHVDNCLVPLDGTRFFARDEKVFTLHDDEFYSLSRTLLDPKDYVKYH
jgi:hypothetical protein